MIVKQIKKTNSNVWNKSAHFSARVTFFPNTGTVCIILELGKRFIYSLVSTHAQDAIEIY